MKHLSILLLAILAASAFASLNVQRLREGEQNVLTASKAVRLELVGPNGQSIVAKSVFSVPSYTNATVYSKPYIVREPSGIVTNKYVIDGTTNWVYTTTSWVSRTKYAATNLVPVVSAIRAYTNTIFSASASTNLATYLGLGEELLVSGSTNAAAALLILEN